ncbi:MAG: hypothetical protein HQL12_06190 [Candidatus Omnitrophica bacterium]|nr:hypothetical protein [Candidatus Omnitrophota bacterium]
MPSSTKKKKIKKVIEAKDVGRKAAIIKKSVAGIGHNVSESAQRVADIILDEDSKLKGLKGKKITDETILMFKGVSRQFKSDLKDVKPRDFIAVGAYSAGKASAAVSRALKMLIG